MPVWTGAATGLLLALAFWSDIRTMRIPNALTGGFFVAGLLAHAAAEGGAGLGQSALGAAAGFIPLALLYLLRGIGAGDVKLFAAIGAWTGAAAVLELLLYSMLAGGIGGAGYLLAVRARRFMRARHEAPPDNEPASRAPSRFPFMLAVVPGALAMLLLGE
ncbi:Type IV prepilin peptidase TadV/CpaA [Paenibacillus pasadenensis]|uniref:Type IV prepilin peptidase TadV/CpaA n=1 Tax=Paenibacillus pasadenensis TaxID=217090 RepID=A0A2N5N3S6_9BACL|nr:A24 family peptidase [Paenibacillus pasadenensis]PLT44970.1 Type IV prepilin peptidase TadV/CpaA [Paenibacillus pasadenensis]